MNTKSSSSGGGCLVILFIIFIISIIATQCTATGDTIKIEGKNVYCDTYGLFNLESHKNEKVIYEVSPGSVIFSIILVETIIAPVYWLGFDLFQPVRVKPEFENPPVIPQPDLDTVFITTPYSLKEPTND